MPKAKVEPKEIKSTGLPKASSQCYHFDLYAILEAPQEIYFGHEVAVNVSRVETVKITTPKEEITKCYLSPTKRRGIERRCLIWAKRSDGWCLGDHWQCGIPHTCGAIECPICQVYGALITSDTKNQVAPLGDEIAKRSPVTLIGRLTHGGGVAIQPQDPELKQRAMHPSLIRKEQKGTAGPDGAEEGEEKQTKPTPMPFKREYNEPSLLYPVYNHCISVEESEFAAVAYAFDQAIARIGAGNPKGAKICEAELLGKVQSLLVLDRYLVPMGKRPIVSPNITSVEEAIEQFRRNTLTVHGETVTQDCIENEAGKFTRWIGDAALKQLQDYQCQFVKSHLEVKEGV